VSRIGGRLTENKIFRAVRGLKARLVRLAFPLYRGARSNHLYTQHQHLVLLVLRQWMGKSYREFCEWMGMCTKVLSLLGIGRMPHFTTLHKFSGRLDEGLLDRLLGSYAEQLEEVQLAVDSTGFSCTSASHYFVEVLKRSKEKGAEIKMKAVRRHLKQTIGVDVDTQLILAMRDRIGPTNDFPDMIPLLRKLPGTARVRAVLADKGYDSEEIRRFIWYTMKAESHIPLRLSRNARVNHIQRRKQAAEFDERKYHRRALVETVHSVLKRVMRDDVLARSRSGQHVELELRTIAYNARRVAIMGDGFY
jgi:hypothetical protein